MWVRIKNLLQNFIKCAQHRNCISKVHQELLFLEKRINNVYNVYIEPYYCVFTEIRVLDALLLLQF